MHLAVANGDAAAALGLMDAGADTKVQNNQGNTLLPAVDGKDECKVAKMLVASGVKPNQPNAGGATALHWAVEQGKADLVNTTTALFFVDLDCIVVS